MMKKAFELRTAEYVLHDIFGDKFVVKNYRKEVKSVADVYGFVFQDEWAEEPWLDETSWYLTYGGKVLWDVKTFLARGKLLAEDGIDTREMSLFDFVDQRVRVSERKGSLILNRLTREFTGPDIPSNEDVVLQYHGLAAYSGSTGFSEKLATCLSKAVVICGSDRANVPVGIVFEGPVFKAHD